MSHPFRIHPMMRNIDAHTGTPYFRIMHAVAETSIFSRRADALLECDDRAALINTLAADPTAGALVSGLGGIRKLRFAPAGRGSPEHSG